MMTLDPELLAAEPIRPLTRWELDRLSEAGSFDDDDRVELLYGVVIKVLPPSPQHEQAVLLLSRILTGRIGERAQVRVGLCFAASDIALPRPDVAIVPEAEYWDDHPTEALLVVEVTRASRHRDRVLKKKLYAESAVQEYWIVDLEDDVIDVHRDPAEGSWRSITRCTRGETVTIHAYPDVQIAVDDLLPPRS